MDPQLFQLIEKIVHCREVRELVGAADSLLTILSIFVGIIIALIITGAVVKLMKYIDKTESEKNKKSPPIS